MTRHLICVDVESSGLRGMDIAVEIAWHDLDTGRHGSFIPVHDRDWVRKFGQPEALALNGYRDRIYPHVPGTPAERKEARTQLAELHHRLGANTLAGSNPAVDADWLESAFYRHTLPDPFRIKPLDPATPWHHRLADLSALTAGTLRINPRRLPGLRDVCLMLGVDPEPDVHTAAGGLAATVGCFHVLDFLQRHPSAAAERRHELEQDESFGSYFLPAVPS